MAKNDNGVQIEGTNGGRPVDAGAGVVTTDAAQAQSAVEIPDGGVVATPVTTDASQAAHPVTSVPADSPTSEED